MFSSLLSKLINYALLLRIHGAVFSSSCTENIIGKASETGWTKIMENISTKSYKTVRFWRPASQDNRSNKETRSLIKCAIHFYKTGKLKLEKIIPTCSALPFVVFRRIAIVISRVSQIYSPLVVSPADFILLMIHPQLKIN